MCNTIPTYNRAYWRNELKDVKKLFIVRENDKATMFSLYYLKNGELIKIYIDRDIEGIPFYWSKTYECFYNVSYGSDRRHDIVRRFERWLSVEPYTFEYQGL